MFFFLMNHAVFVSAVSTTFAWWSHRIFFLFFVCVLVVAVACFVSGALVAVVL